MHKTVRVEQIRHEHCLVIDEFPEIGPLSREAFAQATPEQLEPVQNGRIMPIEAIAAHMELLGFEEVSEVVEAMIYVQDHGEPEPDPSTGENVWTDPYTLLAHREQVREAEAMKALEEGTADDPRSPLLRATLAAYNAVHQPIDGGECAMDRCRRVARERLGLPFEPSKKTTATSRLVSHTPSTAAVKSEDQQEYVSTLEPVIEEIEFSRRNFLHSLTGNRINPLRDTTPLEAVHTVEEIDPFAATLRKYGAK